MAQVQAYKNAILQELVHLAIRINFLNFQVLKFLMTVILGYSVKADFQISTRLSPDGVTECQPIESRPDGTTLKLKSQ